jgi:uncharacterized membrane protein YbhN (UPF0104 family)
MEKSKVKSLILKVAVSGGLFAFLFSKIDIIATLEKLKTMDLRYALVVVVLLILNYVVSSMRWKKLLIFPNSHKAGLGYLTALYFTGSFFNNFMPTSVGGDVYKVLKLGKKIDSKTNAFTATFMERLLGVLVLLLISSASLVQMLGWKSIAAAIALVISTYASLYMLRFVSKKVKTVRSVLDAIKAYKNQPQAIYVAVIPSIIVQLFAIASQYLVFVALGYHPPVIYSMFIIPLITLAGFFIPSLNGIGVQDTLYVSLFANVGVPAEVALTASLLYHILRLVVSLIGGILYAFGFDE